MTGEKDEVITPNEAVKAAGDYFQSVVMPIDSNAQVSVEGIELSTDKTNWLVTLGHRDPTTPALYTLYPGNANKLYKLFTIDAKTGKVLSMKSTKV